MAAPRDPPVPARSWGARRAGAGRCGGRGHPRRRHLVGQVDDRLPTPSTKPVGPRRRPGRGVGPTTDPTARRAAAQPVLRGVVDGDSVVFVQDPDVRDPGATMPTTSAPDIDADRGPRGRGAGEDGDVFTVGSDSADRYRVRAVEDEGPWASPPSLADVDAASAGW